MKEANTSELIENKCFFSIIYYMQSDMFKMFKFSTTYYCVIRRSWVLIYLYQRNTPTLHLLTFLPLLVKVYQYGLYNVFRCFISDI